LTSSAVSSKETDVQQSATSTIEEPAEQDNTPLLINDDRSKTLLQPQHQQHFAEQLTASYRTNANALLPSPTSITLTETSTHLHISLQIPEGKAVKQLIKSHGTRTKIFVEICDASWRRYALTLRFPSTIKQGSLEFEVDEEVGEVVKMQVEKMPVGVAFEFVELWDETGAKMLDKLAVTLLKDSVDEEKASVVDETEKGLDTAVSQETVDLAGGESSKLENSDACIEDKISTPSETPATQPSQILTQTASFAGGISWAPSSTIVHEIFPELLASSKNDASTAITDKQVESIDKSNEDNEKTSFASDDKFDPHTIITLGNTENSLKEPTESFEGSVITMVEELPLPPQQHLATPTTPTEIRDEAKKFAPSVLDLEDPVQVPVIEFVAAPAPEVSTPLEFVTPMIFEIDE
jgi:hypothetical protein